jgi:hypothetical protein
MAGPESFGYHGDGFDSEEPVRSWGDPADYDFFEEPDGVTDKPMGRTPFDDLRDEVEGTIQ